MSRLLYVTVIVTTFLALTSFHCVNAEDNSDEEWQASSPNTLVKVLTDDNFEHDTQAATGMTTGDWFVLFYAPWCSFCKKIKPDWEKLATKFSEHGTSIAQLDCVENGKTCRRFNVHGYPTLILLRRGRAIEFKGARVFEVLQRWLTTESRALEGKPVPQPMGWIGEAKYLYNSIVESFVVLYEEQPTVFITMSASTMLLAVMIMLIISNISTTVKSGRKEAAAAAAAAKGAAPTTKPVESKKTK